MYVSVRLCAHLYTSLVEEDDFVYDDPSSESNGGSLRALMIAMSGKLLSEFNAILSLQSAA